MKCLDEVSGYCTIAIKYKHYAKYRKCEKCCLKCKDRGKCEEVCERVRENDS